MTEGGPTSYKKRFDEWWIERMGSGFDRWPEWLKITLILWTLLAILFGAVDELHRNVPQWFGVVMVAPYALLLFIIVIPAMLARWARWLAGPVRLMLRLIARR